MNILIAGATGKTGLHLVQQLLDQGHTPTALVRESSDTSQLPAETNLRQGDLADLKPDVCDGMDVVIFAAGAGGQAKPETTDKIDRDGAIKLMDIAQKAGAAKFVMLSSIGADQSNPTGDLAHYLKAKHDADEHLKASGLNFVILRPVSLTDHPLTKDVVLGEDVDPSATATRPDVAYLLSEAATTARFDGAAIAMQTSPAAQ